MVRIGIQWEWKWHIPVGESQWLEKWGAVEPRNLDCSLRLHMLHTPASPPPRAFGYGSSNGYRSSFQPSDLSPQATFTAFHDANSVFIGRVSLTDGYPVSATAVSCFIGRRAFQLISVPSLEHFVKKKKTDFSKTITESCFWKFYPVYHWYHSLPV